MGEKSKIGITHDGGLNTQGCKIVDADTGEPIPWVARVEVAIDPREGVRAFIYTIAPELDITTEAELSPHERSMAERIADAVLTRIHNERANLVGALGRINERERERMALELEERLEKRLEAYIDMLHAARNAGLLNG
jgi:hypothetical protein